MKKVILILTVIITICLTSCSPKLKMTVEKRTRLTNGSYQVCGKVQGYVSTQCIIYKSWKKFDKSKAARIKVNEKKIKVIKR